MIVRQGQQGRVKHNFSLRVQGRATQSLEVKGQNPSKKANDSNVATQLRTSCQTRLQCVLLIFCTVKKKKKRRKKSHLTLVGLSSFYFRFPKQKEEEEGEREN